MSLNLNQYKRRLVNKYTRGLFFVIGDTLALLISGLTVFLILSPFLERTQNLPLAHILIITASVLCGLGIFRMYLISWEYVSFKDLIRLILGVALGGVIASIISQFYMVAGTYEHVFTTLMIMMAVLTIGGFRIAKRFYFGLTTTPARKKKHTIIFGADSEGEQILRDILLHNDWGLAVYAMFDDDAMTGLLLHGVKVLGGKKRMMRYLQNNKVDQLIVAVPQYPKKELKVIIKKAKKYCPEIDIKILPSFHSLTDNPVGIKHIRDIKIEDVLGREPIDIDLNCIQKSIADRVVLVTGAGGSIGGELIQQCANLKPSRLIALDIDETELFHVENEFEDQDLELVPCVASIADEDKMDEVLDHYKPDIIFHAAAYKHVPMMESFPEEAIKVNIGGTQLLTSLACKHNVDKFVMVSTDKAVNPTNVMGATKRVAEEICMAKNEKGSTQFISVRFGNVLGSRGSVVPLFIEQIKDGGPVTVTDPEVRRFFMTIPEAVLLVMQAGSMGAGGEVFVLDMGKPVKILDLAKDLIRLHSLEPGRDIEIEFTGLRPGEKMFEELLNTDEGMVETRHPEISKSICSRKVKADDLDREIIEMFNILKTGEALEIRRKLKSMVPTYAFKESAKNNRRLVKDISKVALAE